MAHLKNQGCHIHPDDPDHGYWGESEDIYIRQLCGYIRDNKLDAAKEFGWCRKPHLLEKAIEQGGIAL